MEDWLNAIANTYSEYGQERPQSSAFLLPACHSIGDQNITVLSSSYELEKLRETLRL